MLEWAKFFQNPEYLSIYRMMTLNDEYRSLILKCMGIKNNMRILEVGCGTGIFLQYLSKGVSNCDFYGLDIDKTFILEAKKTCTSLDNRFNFAQGDAYDLPFPDEFFDIVTSYTFFTNIADGNTAMNEMKRVAKRGAVISSITTQELMYAPHFEGLYPVSHSDYRFELEALKNKVNTAYNTVQPIMEYVKYGVPPEKIPLLYVNANLKNISMYPIGCAYSLSNSALDKNEKLRFIRLSRAAEENKINAYAELPEFLKLITLDEINRYIELLKMRELRLIEDVDNNNIWEWQGGAQLLMVARKD